MQPEWRVGAAGGGGLSGGEGGNNPSETLAVMAQALCKSKEWCPHFCDGAEEDKQSRDDAELDGSLMELSHSGDREGRNSLERGWRLRACMEEETHRCQFPQVGRGMPLRTAAEGEARAHLGVRGSPEVVGGPSSQQASLSMTWHQTLGSPSRGLSHPRRGRELQRAPLPAPSDPCWKHKQATVSRC